MRAGPSCPRKPARRQSCSLAPVPPPAPGCPARSLRVSPDLAARPRRDWPVRIVHGCGNEPGRRADGCIPAAEAAGGPAPPPCWRGATCPHLGWPASPTTRRRALEPGEGSRLSQQCRPGRGRQARAWWLPRLQSGWPRRGRWLSMLQAAIALNPLGWRSR